MKLPLGVSAYDRQTGRMPEVELRNRIFEENPTDTVDQVALLSRPATDVITVIGTGNVRNLFSQEGAFGGDLFAVVDDTLYRYDGTTLITVTGTLGGTGTPEFAFSTGPDYEHLFISDGLNLNVYRGEGAATQTLTLTPNTPPDIATQIIEINGTHYQWTSSTPDPTAVGTLADPFEVLVGSDDAGSLANLQAAIANLGVAGTTYSASISVANSDVIVTEVTATTLTIQARATGTGGNAITTTVPTGSDIAWGGATMTGGGGHVLTGVNVPDGSSISSTASLKGFVIAVVADSAKWYFIRPAEIEIQPLDFFTAEDEPDAVVTVEQLGDFLVFLGQSSIEFWYVTGDTTETGDAFLPVDGRSFSIGVVPGTVAKIQDFLIFVGRDNVLYRMGGEPVPITNYSFSGAVRRSRDNERENP